MRKNYRFERNARLAEKIMEWGNFVFAGLVLGQAFSKELNFTLLSLGVIIFFASYAFSDYIMRKGSEKK